MISNSNISQQYICTAAIHMYFILCHIYHSLNQTDITHVQGDANVLVGTEGN